VVLKEMFDYDFEAVEVPHRLCVYEQREDERMGMIMLCPEELFGQKFYEEVWKTFSEELPF
jgi:hypothetical protein